MPFQIVSMNFLVLLKKNIDLILDQLLSCYSAKSNYFCGCIDEFTFIVVSGINFKQFKIRTIIQYLCHIRLHVHGSCTWIRKQHYLSTSRQYVKFNRQK